MRLKLSLLFNSNIHYFHYYLKQVVFVMLDGGSDSHNMLVPHSGCTGSTCKCESSLAVMLYCKSLLILRSPLLSVYEVSYDHYASVRGTIAVPKADLLAIDASSSSQFCSRFGMHPNLSFLKSLYDDGDLLWVANVGILPEHVTKDNWRAKTSNTELFAHNIQSDEVHLMDIFDQQVGTGVGGRMTDVMERNGFSAATVSINGIVHAVTSSLAPSFILDPWAGLEKLNPSPWAQPLWEKIKKLNSVAKIGSSLFGETWSKRLFSAVGEVELLKDTLDAATVATPFPPSNHLGEQLELVAKMIKSKETRGKWY